METRKNRQAVQGKQRKLNLIVLGGAAAVAAMIYLIWANLGGNDPSADKQADTNRSNVQTTAYAGASPNKKDFALRNYIIPGSDTEAIKDEQISNLDARLLELARNEIYARHGYVFKREDLNAYFHTKSWYKEDSEYRQEVSAVEKENLAQIQRYEGLVKGNGLKHEADFDRHIRSYRSLDEDNDDFKQLRSLVDLDGDGNLDRMELLIQESPVDADITEWTLKVNEATLQGDTPGMLPYVQIVDLDTRDPYLEFAFQDYGMAGDYSTHFYYYDGHTIQPMSEYGLAGFMADASLIDGKGHVKGAEEIRTFQTWFRETAYALDKNHQLQQVKQDFYPMEPATKLVLKQNLSLLASPDDTVSSVKLKKGETVYFAGIDDNDRVRLDDAQGVVGWLRLDEKQNQLYGTKTDITDVFDGTLQYD
ncbi:YARHG domain-containing protein [Paenibacillus sp. MMS18-CY102]|uniref:YARHG domain-containing protein n=1 Tax=Paenibacillus sp. MMS18-CY102 TaxID=2682849 RepID=UPI0013661522|nr:YARHG domain-containing protein [Paenibacillus sp. MMS18-CY102]MWC28009.1 YARHG domain-containing protein [Paenibacillus sp. MMS18-CY102]